MNANNNELSLPTPTPNTNTAEFDKHFQKALTLAESDKEAAIAEMELALQVSPDNKVALKWTADWYSTLNRPEDEANIYRRWIKTDPKDMRAHGLLASLLIRELRQYPEGLEEAQAARSLCTGRTCYVYDRVIAQAYEGLNNYPKAIDYYQLYLKGAKKEDNPSPAPEVLSKITELRMKVGHE